MLLKLLLNILLVLTFIACSEKELTSKKEASTNTKTAAPKVKKDSLSLKNPQLKKKTIHLPANYPIKSFPNSKKVINYCQKIDKYFKKYKWGKSNCEKYSWHHVRSSYLGNPIMWFVYGDEKKHKKTPLNTTMILCSVHGDEITPVKFCFDVLHDLKKNPKLVENNLIVIAPIVSPDSFFKKRPTRTNARGVDVNRNFPTRDWDKSALRLWKRKYKSSKRRFPGNKAFSEQETIFQVNLIKRYKPNKILSIHAPLSLLDYDGPEGHSHGHSKLAKQLLIQMSNKAGKYKMMNYPFFTGSLGNWAGNERKIPTYTIELPNSDWHKTDRYFKMFKSAIHSAITHDMGHEKN